MLWSFGRFIGNFFGHIDGLCRPLSTPPISWSVPPFVACSAPQEGGYPHTSAAPIPMQFVSPLDHQFRLPKSAPLAIRDRPFHSLLAACFLCLLIRRFAPVEGPWSARSGRDVFPATRRGALWGETSRAFGPKRQRRPWPCVQRTAGHDRRTRRADQTTRAAGASDD